MDNAYASIVATVAAIASAGALYLHWIRWRHDQRSKSLIVKVTPSTQSPSVGDWSAVTLTLRSRSNTGYTAKRISVLWPPSGRLAWRESLFTVAGEHDWDELQFQEPAHSPRQLEAALVVSHAGQKSAFHPQAHFRTAYGDKESAEFFLKRNGRGRVLLAIDIEPEDISEPPFTRRRWISL